MLSIVDQTHLPTKIADNITKSILGWYVYSLLFMNIVPTHFAGPMK